MQVAGAGAVQLGAWVAPVGGTYRSTRYEVLQSGTTGLGSGAYIVQFCDVDCTAPNVMTTCQFACTIPAGSAGNCTAGPKTGWAALDTLIYQAVDAGCVTDPLFNLQSVGGPQ
jgi:hypothetical protein